MKKLIVLGAMMLVALGATAQGKFKITGRAIDQTDQPVAYSTVVLLDGEGRQVVGTATTAEGLFELSAAKGNYTLLVTFIGFENNSQPIALTQNIDLGNIVLISSSQEIGAVVITEHAIRREADRFIVTVANNPLATSKDAFEMLRTAPGVWTSKSSGITINGSSGTRVMIDDRVLNMDSEDLEAYLRSIPATDIQRIEVIPTSGADYDADSSGGIIKIIMVKKRTSGIDGTIGARAEWAPHYNGFQIMPNGRLNYFDGKLNLYTQLGYTNDDGYNEGREKTDYASGENISSNTLIVQDNERYNARLGAVYDLTPKSSIGAEVSYYGNDSRGRTNAFSFFSENENSYIRDTSLYNSINGSTYLGTSLNYILKLDDKGSTFKVLGDWSGNIGDNNNRYQTNATIDDNGSISNVDSLYRNVSDSRYNAYTIGTDVELIRSAAMSIKFGAKYTRNELYAQQKDAYSPDGSGATWIEANTAANQPTNYNENIGALYGIYNQKFGNISMSLGLRGEYAVYNPTYINPQTGKSVTTTKEYIDIFPTVSLNVPFNQNQTHILIANISRRIYRPGFWALNPFRMQLSEYSYVEGNPNLKPMYSNNATLTYVYKYRYTLSLGAQLQENYILQTVVRDTTTSKNVLAYQHVNIPVLRQYFIALNAPFVFTDWWSINLNSFYMIQEQKLTADSKSEYSPMGMLNFTSSFTLPKKWEIELSFWGMTAITQGSMEVEPMYSFSANISKRIGKWTFGVYADNIVSNNGMKIHNTGTGFENWSTMYNNYLVLGLSVRYNFNAGIKFRARTVESGSDESRMSGGGGIGIGTN